MSKIAIICPLDYPVPAVKGGAIETLIEIFLNENEIYKSCEIIVYSYFEKNAKVEAEKYINTNFVFIKVGRLRKKIDDFFIKIMRKLFKIEIPQLFLRNVIKDIKKIGINTVLIEGNKDYVIPLRKLNKDIDLYLHIHSDAFAYNKKLNRDIIKSCKKVITVSDFIAKKTLGHISEYNGNNIVTLANCVDKRFFKNEENSIRNPFKERYNISDNDFVIIFSGRIIKEKGVKELILAFKKYCLNLNMKLLIIGNAGFGKSIKSNYDEEVLDLAEEMDDKIIFTGFIHNSKLPQINELADIAIIPSIWDEPAGMVVVEAIASGIPIVTTNSGGIPEYINSKCSISIKRDKDIVDNLGKSILTLYYDTNLREKMSIEAKLKSREFIPNVYYKNLIKILNIDGDKTYENKKLN